VASFGENLRRERELRGISLEEIAATTKIKVGFLEAIENDDLARLPGGIFARGFMRTYAAYLGLDADQFIAEYQAAAQPKDYELGRFKSANRAALPDKPRPPVLPFLVAAALLIGGYSIFHYSHRAPEVREALPSAVPAPASPLPAFPPPASPASGQAAAAPTTTTHPEVRKRSGRAGADKAVADKAVADNKANAAPAIPLTAPLAAPITTPAGQAPPTTEATEPSSDAATAEANRPGPAPANAAAPRSDRGPDHGLVLKLAVTQPVWVSVDADGKTSLQRVLSPNHVATLKARDSFDITTGNAQAVTLTLNGQTLKPLGGKDEVKRVHLTQEDAKSPSP
jgi:cytoskeleton protein RodZ